MPARSGERAERGGTFHCAVCGEKVRVHEGEEIPRCPNGHDVFNKRSNEPEE